MKRVEDGMRFFLDNAWRRAAGKPELIMPELGAKKLDDKMLLDRWNTKFIELMRNRIRMGRLRYGPSTNKYNYAEGAKLKLQRYIQTGNLEYLVDVANYAMLEFGAPSKEGTFFKAEDDGKLQLPRLD